MTASRKPGRWGGRTGHFSRQCGVIKGTEAPELAWCPQWNGFGCLITFPTIHPVVLLWILPFLFPNALDTDNMRDSD